MRALEGVRVLELSRVLAGPWCGMTLADLGAEVIKIEPLGGDDTRALGPPFRDGMSAYFACTNRNKRSLALDLGKPAARPILDRLVQQADVLIQNYRLGTDRQLGVDYERLGALNPRLVYCHITGYGRTGPDRERPGYDFAIQAEAGLMSITGPRSAEPSKVGVAVADISTGQNAAIAILAALRHRDRTGQGQLIDLSLYDTQLQELANVASSVLFTGSEAQRHGNAHANIVPYQPFRAADRPFVLAVASARLWSVFCAAVDRPQWRDDPRYVDNAARVAHREALVAELDALFATRDAAHWMELLGRAGVPCAPINSVGQALEHPVALARGMRITLGGVPLLGSPLNLAATPVRYELPPPRLGEHTDAILAELGEDAAALRAAGVVA